MRGTEQRWAAAFLAAALSAWSAPASGHDHGHGALLGKVDCGIGKVAFAVEVVVERGKAAAGAAKTSQVLLSREGKPELTVPLPVDARYVFWEPSVELETACEEALAAVLGDAAVVVLADESRPGAPRVAAFVYRYSQHRIAGVAPDLGLLSGRRRARIRKDDVCFASGEPSRPAETCYRHRCGEAEGKPIVKTEVGLGFDEWVCLRTIASGLKAAVDPELTFAGLEDERLRAVFPSRAQFDKAFGWDPARRKYRARTFAVATREDASRCVAPVPAGADERTAERRWVCPAPAAGE